MTTNSIPATPATAVISIPHEKSAGRLSAAAPAGSSSMPMISPALATSCSAMAAGTTGS